MIVQAINQQAGSENYIMAHNIIGDVHAMALFLRWYAIYQ